MTFWALQNLKRQTSYLVTLHIPIKEILTRQTYLRHSRRRIMKSTSASNIHPNIFRPLDNIFDTGVGPSHRDIAPTTGLPRQHYSNTPHVLLISVWQCSPNHGKPIRFDQLGDQDIRVQLSLRTTFRCWYSSEHRLPTDVSKRCFRWKVTSVLRCLSYFRILAPVETSEWITNRIVHPDQYKRLAGHKQ